MVTLQIVVTEKCNLSCSYCYMSNRNTFLTRETFMDFYGSLPSDQEYSIDFFGGEPLLNWDMVVFITETVKDDPRFKKYFLPSNGLLLTQDMVDYIKLNDIKFSWSCDGVSIKDLRGYLNKADLISQVCDTVSVVASPDNLDFIGNYWFFLESFGVTPEFKLMKAGWTEESVTQYKANYSEYIDFLVEDFKDSRKKVPADIIQNMKVLFEGIKKGTPKPRCIDSERICLMTDGSTGFCGYTCTTGDPSMPVDHGFLYSDCVQCEYNNFCSKGCYKITKDDGGLDYNICELTKYTLNETIRFNHLLKNDVVWTRRYASKIFEDYKDNK